MASHALTHRPKKANVFEEALAQICTMDSLECGTPEMKRQFAIADDYRNLNHGSFGTYPTPVRSYFELASRESEARPDKFIRYDYPKLLDQSREYVAGLLNVPVETCVLVSNATLAFNTIFRSLIFQPDDVIITFATAYGACEKTVIYMTEITPVEMRKVEYTFPISDDALCEAFEKTIEATRSAGKNPKIATFDTIVSLPGVRMPFERLTKICKSHGVLSCIDGAHGIGHIELNLTALDPDFFLSNCHKWLYTPRGCAVLYVPKRNQDLIRSSLPTSHFFEPLAQPEGRINNPLPSTTKGRFVMNFEFSATLDNSPYVCIPAAVEWRKKVTWQGKKGEGAVMGYCKDVVKRGGDIVARKLGTTVMENQTGSLRDCAFSTVSLPLSFEADAGGDMADASTITFWFSKIMVEEYGTFMAIIFYDNQWWVRLSGQVYLDEQDFEWAAGVLAEVCGRIKEGAWRG